MAKRVIIVDDHGPAADVLAQMLRVLGHETKVFGSAADCLEWLASDTPDIAFLDLKMPGIDGVTLLSRIRQRGQSFPVIVVTGYPESNLVQEAQALGAAAVATKPLSMDVLQGLVALA